MDTRAQRGRGSRHSREGAASPTQGAGGGGVPARCSLRCGPHTLSAGPAGRPLPTAHPAPKRAFSHAVVCVYLSDHSALLQKRGGAHVKTFAC